MRTDFYFVLLLGVYVHHEVQGSSLSNRISGRSPVVAAQTAPEGTFPANKDDFPDGFWFGTQNLFCVMGVSGSPSSVGRKKRAIKNTYPARYSLQFAHRLLYYKGLLYEWGTGTMGYFMGDSPSVVECPVIWEKLPTGNSTCSTEAVKQFTYEYRNHFGVYNIATNNCHHFANRISALLSSPNCDVRPAPWSQLSRRFWRYLGGWFSQHPTAPITLNDIRIHHDRSTIH